MLKEIPVVFDNGSKYEYHFIIKELAEKFEEKFECLGENTEKCISSFQCLVDNLPEWLHNDKCTDCKSYLEYISTKDDL